VKCKSLKGIQKEILFKEWLVENHIENLFFFYNKRKCINTLKTALILKMFFD